MTVFVDCSLLRPKLWSGILNIFWLSHSDSRGLRKKFPEKKVGVGQWWSAHLMSAPLTMAVRKLRWCHARKNGKNRRKRLCFKVSECSIIWIKLKGVSPLTINSQSLEDTQVGYVSFGSKKVWAQEYRIYLFNGY